MEDDLGYMIEADNLEKFKKPFNYEFGKENVSIDLPHCLESSGSKLTY